MDAVGRKLLVMLDGTRDRYALLEELGRLVVSGQIIIEREGKAISDTEAALNFLAGELDHNLAAIARLALLTA